MVCVSRTFVLSGNEGLEAAFQSVGEDPNPLTDRHLLKFSSRGATELMLTWTSLWGLLQFDVNRKAEEASHLCPAACFYRAHHPEIDPKPDAWTKAMRASTYICSCYGSV